MSFRWVRLLVSCCIYCICSWMVLSVWLCVYATERERERETEREREREASEGLTVQTFQSLLTCRLPDRPETALAPEFHTPTCNILKPPDTQFADTHTAQPTCTHIVLYSLEEAPGVMSLSHELHPVAMTLVSPCPCLSHLESCPAAPSIRPWWYHWLPHMYMWQKNIKLYFPFHPRSVTQRISSVQHTGELFISTSTHQREFITSKSYKKTKVKR